MGVFETLSDKILSLVKKKDNTKITQENFISILKLQKESLDNLYSTLLKFNTNELSKLSKFYYNTKFDHNNKNDVSYILPTLMRKYKGKALVLEKKSIFGAALFSVSVFIKLNEELLRNIDKFVKDEGIKLYEGKISTVMFYGILMETDFLINYITYLWGHFSGSISKTKLYPIPYQAKFLRENLDPFINLINNTCEKDATYSLVKEQDQLRKQNIDMLLYNNGQTFLNFLDTNAISGTGNRKLINGVIGLNIVSKIVMVFNSWKHAQYMKNKMTKEYYENKVALMRFDLLGVDPNSEEYKTIAKRIELYEEEISKLDREIKTYEEEED